MVSEVVEYRADITKWLLTEDSPDRRGIIVAEAADKPKPASAEPPIIGMQEPSAVITLMPPFELVRHLVEDVPPLRRPNRNHPVHDAALLCEELAGWDQASDEDFLAFEDGIPE